MRDGVIAIDKPEGFTSFDVVAKVRGMLHIRRVGHAGTLDPMATGVLPVFIGRGTKACDILPVQDKRYTAALRLGITTDTQDITGTVLTERPAAVSEAAFREAVNSFVGEQLQLPPMYSAVKVDGKKLYEIARQGGTIERTPRPVTFYSIEILRFDGREAVLDVRCSKGSYIRTLAHDIGEKLGCGAVLTALRRTEAAGFTPEDCITLESLAALAEEGRAEEAVLPVERLFRTLEKTGLPAGLDRLYQNGVRLECCRLGIPADGAETAVYDAGGNFLGVGVRDTASGCLIGRKLFRLDGPQ